MKKYIQTKALTLLMGAFIFISAPSQVLKQNSTLMKSLGSNEKGNVHRGLADKKGNLWFGTTGEGIYRYDGTLFTQFTTDNVLSSNTIFAVFEDRDQNLWFGTQDGVTLYDGKEFISMPVSKSKNAVWCIIQDRKGVIWVGSAGGVYCYTGNGFVPFLDNHRIVNAEGLNLKSTESMLEDRNGTIWFGSYVGEGISFFDGQYLRSLKPNVTRKSFGHVRVMSLLEDRKRNLWFGTGDGAYRFDRKNLEKFGEKEGLDWVYSMLEDQKGNLWFTTEKGSGEIDEPGGVWRFDGTLFTHFSTKEGLVHNGVFAAVEDQRGNLWFGTRNFGLSRFDGLHFTTFSE